MDFYKKMKYREKILQKYKTLLCKSLKKIPLLINTECEEEKVIYFYKVLYFFWFFEWNTTFFYII